MVAHGTFYIGCSCLCPSAAIYISGERNNSDNLPVSKPNAAGNAPIVIKQPQHGTDAFLSSEQLGAMKRSIRLGRQLQIDHPELLEMYKSKLTLQQIAEKIKVGAANGVTAEIAKVAVSYALRGHDGRFSIAAYAGMAPEEELDRMEREHRVEGYLRTGLTQYIDKANATAKRKGVGIYSIPKECQRDLGRATGSVQGKLNRDNKIGIGALTRRELKIASRKGVIARGNTPWFKTNSDQPSERDFVSTLSKLTEYKHQNGSCKGMPNWKLITEAVNQKYHQGKSIRTVEAVMKVSHR